MSSSTKSLVFDQVSFRNLVIQIANDVFPDQHYGFRKDSCLLLQQVTEKFVIEMFETVNSKSKRCGHDILLPKDIILGLLEMNFDYIRLSQREKPKSLMKLFNIYKK